MKAWEEATLNRQLRNISTLGSVGQALKRLFRQIKCMVKEKIEHKEWKPHIGNEVYTFVYVYAKKFPRKKTYERSNRNTWKTIKGNKSILRTHTHTHTLTRLTLVEQLFA